MYAGIMTAVCAAILAGGKSRRMRKNKALIEYQGMPLIERVAACASSVTDEVIVCANDRSLYSFLGLPVAQDRFPNCGPLAGLHAAFLSTDREKVLLLACDLPDITPLLLSRLAAEIGDYDAIIPMTSDFGAHPLCAVYSRTCFSRVADNLCRGQFRMLDVFENTALHVRFLNVSEIGFQDYLLRNLNTPEDL